MCSCIEATGGNIFSLTVAYCLKVLICLTMLSVEVQRRGYISALMLHGEVRTAGNQSISESNVRVRYFMFLSPVTEFLVFRNASYKHKVLSFCIYQVK